MPGTAGRVLVVDDSQVIRQLITVILELDGFEVMTVADGAECLDVVRRFRPHVVTLDGMMPRLDGARTAERLRGDPRTEDIPLVLVSAAPPGLSEIETDADAIVPKPFEPAELTRQVRWLHRHGRPGVVRLAKSLAG